LVQGRDCLKQEGLSIILVEQNAKLVFDIADEIVSSTRAASRCRESRAI
jgi:ABC-type branched-subunit amino acid transport system ATPase component